MNPDIPAKWRSAPQSKAEEAYSRNHAGAMNLLNLVREKLENLPAPDSGVAINWAHVGSLSHVNEKLSDIAEFLHSHDCPS